MNPDGMAARFPRFCIESLPVAEKLRYNGAEKVDRELLDPPRCSEAGGGEDANNEEAVECKPT